MTTEHELGTLRITRGNPTQGELTALTVVLAALIRRGARPAEAAPSDQPRPASWSRTPTRPAGSWRSRPGHG